jgi:hypothetical protein
VKLSRPRRRHLFVKWGALLCVVVVVLAACSGSRQQATERSGPTTTVGQSPTTLVAGCRGCSRATAKAASLCRGAFGDDLLTSAPTTVHEVRRSGIGIVGNLHPHAFPGLSNREFAAWCMLRTDRKHCYDEWALGRNHAREHIVKSCDPTLREAPHAGPAYWTY